MVFAGFERVRDEIAATLTGFSKQSSELLRSPEKVLLREVVSESSLDDDSIREMTFGGVFRFLRLLLLLETTSAFLLVLLLDLYEISRRLLE